MAVYVDDSAMDAEKALRDTLWKANRAFFFKSGTPSGVQKTLAR